MDVGAHLRSSREAQGISLALLAARTRVQPRILSAIETNDLGGIPPKPYGRGFVRAYAQELGLDPDRVVHDYFGQFPSAPVTVAATPPPLEKGHSIAAFVPAALAILIGLGLVAALWQNARTASPPPLTPAVGTTGVSPAPVNPPAPSVVESPQPAQPTPPTPPRAADQLTLVIRAERDCWVAASADGTRVIYQILPAGSERTLNASREIVFRAGDAGALRLRLNGRDTGSFGQPGEVRDARITLANAAAFGRVSSQQP